uniref:Uncharacterized protein n=1 Tax=Rhipicephalus appendiculatus TaxID=34631 RepID=A0A131YEE9_RHIAP
MNFFFLIWLPSPKNFSCPSKLSLPLHLWLATQTNEHYSERGKKTAATLPEAMFLREKCFETTTHLSTSEDSVLCVYHSLSSTEHFLAPPFCRTIGGSTTVNIKFYQSQALFIVQSLVLLRTFSKCVLNKTAGWIALQTPTAFRYH